MSGIDRVITNLILNGSKWMEVQHSSDIKIKHGLLNRWTDIFILPRTPWGLTFNPNSGTKIQSIFVKLSENIFLVQYSKGQYTLQYLKPKCDNVKIS